MTEASHDNESPNGHSKLADTIPNAGTPDGKIKLVRIAHVYYKHKNFEKQQQFLEDFGFFEAKRSNDTIYYRGLGTEPFLYVLQAGEQDEFGGAAFVVESYQDLVKASKTLPNASDIYELVDAPGRGLCVTFRDPIDDFPFHLVYGQTPAENETVLPQLQFNFVCGSFVRYDRQST